MASKHEKKYWHIPKIAFVRLLAFVIILLILFNQVSSTVFVFRYYNGFDVVFGSIWFFLRILHCLWNLVACVLVLALGVYVISNIEEKMDDGN